VAGASGGVCGAAEPEFEFAELGDGDGQVGGSGREEPGGIAGAEWDAVLSVGVGVREEILEFRI
jgi:hypothetical protein